MTIAGLVEERTGKWQALLADLIRVPSLYEEEAEILAFMEARLGELGVTPVKVPFDGRLLATLDGAQPPISNAPDRHNLVVRVPGTGAGSSLVINTQLDIVAGGDPASWTQPPFSGHIDRQKNVVYGRGAMDGKAGVAIALALIEVLTTSETPPPGDVIFYFVLEDETGGNGSLLCLNAGHIADAAIIIDGTRPDWGINQHVGNVRFSVEMHGKPASVSVSHMGLNAGEKLFELLLEMRRETFALNDGRPEPWTIFPSPNQFTTEMISCDSLVNTLPEFATARCYATYTPPLTLAGFKSMIETLAQDFARRHELPRPPAVIWDGMQTEPVASPSAELEAVIQGAAHDLGMTEINFGPSSGNSDMRHFLKLGIPCVLYGPGRGYNPHRVDEHYFLDDLPAMVRLFHGVVFKTETKALRGTGHSR